MTHVPCVCLSRTQDALNQWMDRASHKPDFSALAMANSSSKAALKQPLQSPVAFTLAKDAPKTELSSLQLLPPDADVPLKDASVFAYADATFPSTRGHRPELIMATLKRAFAYFDTIEVRETSWRFDVACLCVAELVAFTVQLVRLGDDGSVSDRTSFEVGFHRTAGDETRYLALVDCIRARCSAIDDDALPILDDTLEPWMDARQTITDPRAVLEPKDALELLKHLRADLHAKTRFEVAKTLKNHCRHARNRLTFYRVDPKHFLQCLQDLVASPSLELTRLGVFILLEFANDAPSDAARARRAPFFHSPYEKRTFALQLADVVRAHHDAPCGTFVRAMVQRVQQSWLFA